MSLLLKLTALIEAATGFALIIVPPLVVRPLLGSDLLGTGIPLGRLAGVALLALGMACWLALFETQSCAAREIVGAMVLYNIGAVLVLAGTGLRSQPVVGSHCRS